MTEAARLEALRHLRRLRGVSNPTAHDLALPEWVLFDLKAENLVVEAPLVAQHHRWEDPPVVGVRRWVITDKASAALRE